MHVQAERGISPVRPFGLGRVNAGLLAGGVFAIIVGYVLLGRGSITIAPLLLVLGYAVLIPAGLLVGFKGEVARESGE